MSIGDVAKRPLSGGLLSSTLHTVVCVVPGESTVSLPAQPTLVAPPCSGTLPSSNAPASKWPRQTPVSRAAPASTHHNRTTQPHHTTPAHHNHTHTPTQTRLAFQLARVSLSHLQISPPIDQPSTLSSFFILSCLCAIIYIPSGISPGSSFLRLPFSISPLPRLFAPRAPTARDFSRHRGHVSLPSHL